MSTINRTSDLTRYLDTLLGGITIANGFATDIGMRHYRGRRNLDASLAPCCVLIAGEDSPLDQAGGRDAVVVRQRYAVMAIVPCDADNPNDAANDAVEDVMQAMFSEGRTLGGRVQRIDYVGRLIGAREDGEATVQIVVHVDITIAQALVRR